MADNFVANPGAGGDTFAADEIVEVKSAPVPSRPIVLQSVPIPPIDARAQIIESLIRQAAKIRQEIEEEETELLLLF
ncbi:MAG TPA: hypothetical protein VLH56_10285 [Dissulfurispiraceae bacterium]|nr:hypothetical protein [Dissulfurispiraceae bacterium]